MSKLYCVEMTGLALMRGSFTVAADNEGAAGAQAKERSGDVSWAYQGMDDTTIEVTSVVRLNPQADARPQIPLRNAVRCALREIAETHRFQIDTTLVDKVHALRRMLRKAPRPWGAEVLDSAEGVLHEVSAAMGDHSLWNIGGQGYRAVKMLNREVG